MTINPTTPTMTRQRRSSTSSVASRRAKRHYVEHNYRDHYNDPIYVPGESDEEMETPKRRGPRGGVVVPFPERLYNMLCQVEEDGFEDVISWQPHGRCFIVHDPKRFVDEVMPKYFRQSKLTSFQRQVNLYGFRRLTAGKDRGAYYHELFLRGRADLYKRLVRIRVKGTGIKSASSPSTEPDFYTYPRCAENDAAKSIRSKDEDMEMNAFMPIADTTSSSQFVSMEDALPAKPIWKPLSAPPKMVMVSPELGPIEATSMGMSSGLKKSFGESDFEDPWRLPTSTSGLLSLSSMAKGIVFGSTSSLTTSAIQEDPCPITPESTLRQIVSNELDQALAMVSPGDSPIPSTFPSMASLAHAPASMKHQDLLALGPETAMDFKMDTFQEGIEALLESDFSGFPEMPGTDVKQPTDYSLDPLFLLDEVVGN
ncbi:stress transcription factor B-2b [Seminavis robusta]|uniref:Stress transcription factor B-2b n=1 Tax=Seminavis robusta TaxID=568900 RepID=A0A9N8EWF0_9STRA|nr:stress transcription factor B-2b [Seminavis robusta]|eukprot:Sro1900_g304250.1 stress transcription factor B-2b (426) ;mRNA; r:7765-9123